MKKKKIFYPLRISNEDKGCFVNMTFTRTYYLFALTSRKAGDDEQTFYHLSSDAFVDIHREHSNKPKSLLYYGKVRRYSAISLHDASVQGYSCSGDILA